MVIEPQVRKLMELIQGEKSLALASGGESGNG